MNRKVSPSTSPTASVPIYKNIENSSKEVGSLSGSLERYSSERVSGEIDSPQSRTSHSSGYGLLRRSTDSDSTRQKHGGIISKVLDFAVRKSQQRERVREGSKEGKRKQHVDQYKRHPFACPSGGMTCLDEQIIKAQRSVVVELIKQVGKNVLMGRDLLYVTFPIKCCAPESALQRFGYAASYAPTFLAQAAKVKDNPLERFKLVVAFYIAGMHNTCVFMKPLNPILGETYQAQLDSETFVYVEQSSHHPPVTQVLVKGQGYRFYSWVTYSAHFRYNHLKLVHKGFRVVYFDDGTEIKWDNPYDVFNGVFWGNYSQETLGEVHFEDEKNHIHLDLKLGNVKGYPSDHFEGKIYQTPKEKREVSGKKGVQTPVCLVRGSWLSFLEFDDECYWQYHQDEKFIPFSVSESERLPSDSIYREDLIFLERGDLEVAQKKKIELEEIQRHERKLRTKKSSFSIFHPFQKNN
eukprot:jgi/Galph1/3562/GphlegSOOS_G2236.1